MNDNPIKRYLRTPQMLSSFGISRTTLHRWINRGVIPRPIKLGNVCLWPEDVLDAIG